MLSIQTCKGYKSHQHIGIRKKQRSNDPLVQQFRFALWEKSEQNLELPEESLVQVRCLVFITVYLK